MNKEEILLIYDKECSACNNYCQMVQIKETVGDLKIINARDSSDVMQEITDADLDIDQGMVLKLGDKLYYGSDAIHALALMNSRSGMFNRVNYWMFKSERVSKLLYPMLRSFRNLLLKGIGVSKINNLNKDGNDTF